MALTNYVLMPGADYQALCNAIRAKTGKTEALKSGDLASEVESITGGGGAEITEFLPTTTFTNDYFSDFGVFVYFIPLEAEMMVAWVDNRKPVTVVYDGEEYNLTPQVLTGADGSDGVCVGNLSAFGGTGNNEPFAVVPWNIDGVDGLLIGSTVDTAPTQHTIRIYQEASISMEGVYTVTFMSEDGSSVLYERLVVDGDDCANVVDRGLLDAPTKESTAQYEYTYSGWSLTSGGSADASALSAVKADRTVYAAFTSAVRYYTITYYDSDGVTVLKTESLAYGDMPSYTPKKDKYDFVAWEPVASAVTGDASYTATWKEKATFETATWGEIGAICAAGNAAEHFAVGDTRAIPLNYADGTSEIINFTIVDMGVHTTTAGEKAALTLMAENIVAISPIKPHSSSGGYIGLERHDNMATCLGNIFSAMPTELQEIIKTTKVGISNSQKIFIACADNLGISSSDYSVQYNPDYATKFKHFANGASVKRTKLTDESVDDYWTNSCVYRSGTNVGYLVIDGTTKISAAQLVTSALHGVVPCFCI